MGKHPSQKILEQIAERRQATRKVLTARVGGADALAEAVANHIADPDDPHTLLDLVKALHEYREEK